MAPLVASGKVLGRQFGRRDGRSRLARGARREHRQGRLESVQYRTRQGRLDRASLQALLPARSRQGPWRQDLAARSVEDRRRDRVGLAELRSQAQPRFITAPSNPGPWNPDQRPGDNKWSTGVFARDVNTGQAVWYYQSSPHDLFDHAFHCSAVSEVCAGSARRKALGRRTAHFIGSAGNRVLAWLAGQGADIGRKLPDLVVGQAAGPMPACHWAGLRRATAAASIRSRRLSPQAPIVDACARRR